MLWLGLNEILSEVFRINENARIGSMGEVIVELDCLSRGFNVLRPTATDRYDLVVDDGRGLRKVQVKVGRFDARQSPATLKASFETPYTPDEVDVIAVVDQASEVVYYVLATDLVAGVTNVTVRFERASRETSAFDGTRCLDWPYEGGD